MLLQVLEIFHRLNGCRRPRMAAAARRRVVVKGTCARLTIRFAVDEAAAAALPATPSGAAMDWSTRLLRKRADHSAWAFAVFQGEVHHRGGGFSRHTTAFHPPMFAKRFANSLQNRLSSTDISSDVTYQRRLDTMRAYAGKKKLSERRAARSKGQKRFTRRL